MSFLLFLVGNFQKNRIDGGDEMDIFFMKNKEKEVIVLSARHIDRER